MAFANQIAERDLARHGHLIGCKSCGSGEIAVGAVGVSVDDRKFVVVMLVGRSTGRAAGIVHAGILARAVFTGMTKAERVADFLAHDVSRFVRIAGVRGGVAIIHFCSALGDMAAAVEVDRSQAEPAVVAIGRVADANLAGDCGTSLAGCAAVAIRTDNQVELGRRRPLRRGCGQQRGPVGIGAAGHGAVERLQVER